MKKTVLIASLIISSFLVASRHDPRGGNQGSKVGNKSNDRDRQVKDYCKAVDKMNNAPENLKDYCREKRNSSSSKSSSNAKSGHGHTNNREKRN